MNTKIPLLAVVAWVCHILPATAQILRHVPLADNEKPAAEVINKAYDYNYFFPFKEQDTLHLTTGQKRDTLEARYAQTTKDLKRVLKAVKDKNRREWFEKVNEQSYLNFKLRLWPNDSEERWQMLSQINPNDSVGLLNYLPSRFVESKLRGDYNWGGDLTDYGLDFLTVIRQYITDPTVRRYLLSQCARETLCYGKNFSDIDGFWVPFCEMAKTNDQVVIDQYQYKVDAIKTTKAGTKTIDFAFNDTEGNTHHISEYFGRVIYIDCWATWCGPCVKEIPFLEKHVEAFQSDSRIMFLSISMDENLDAWRKKLDKDQPQWPQMVVSREQNEQLSRAYGITGIPRFIVINADGTIAETDAFRPSDPNFVQRLQAIIDAQ